MGLLAEAGADATPIAPFFGTADVLLPRGGRSGGGGKSGVGRWRRRRRRLRALVYAGGDVTPFDMSLCFLVAGGVLISLPWSENTDLLSLQPRSPPLAPHPPLWPPAEKGGPPPAPPASPLAARRYGAARTVASTAAPQRAAGRRGREEEERGEEEEEEEGGGAG